MRHNVTIADALYVVVARRLEVALVTGDLAACVQLIAAAHAADGYLVRWPNDPIKWLTPPWALAALVAEANHRLVGHVLLVGLDEQNRAGSVAAVRRAAVAYSRRRRAAPRGRGCRGHHPR